MLHKGLLGSGIPYMGMRLRTHMETVVHGEGKFLRKPGKSKGPATMKTTTTKTMKNIIDVKARRLETTLTMSSPKVSSALTTEAKTPTTRMHTCTELHLFAR